MTNEVSLQDVANYLDNFGIQFLATIGLDGKPKVRPMQYMILEDDKLWFCTNSEKDVYKELQANPSLELCGCRLEENEIQTPWIRFSAEAVFEERQDIRDAIIEKSSIVNALYSKMRENPIFKVFYLKNIDGWMTNLGNVKGLEKRAEFAKPIHFEF
ncbi:MAG: pyridoxamine 5'-phosphate oxidase family protein [Bacteroidales bacterium]|nr:pyridoxamine 5'-phosphate oxidase family protein [Bacteroidales bacterium]